jgi:hypothetical protein
MSYAESVPTEELSLGRADPELLYDQALSVSRQWFELWDITGDKRHLQTAMTCCQMARERFNALMVERRNRRLSTQTHFAERHDTLQAVLQKARENTEGHAYEDALAVSVT